MQWALEHALAKPIMDPAEFDPRVIAARFSVLAFAAIQSSVITITNAIFDLAASGECAKSLEVMREEVLEVAEGAEATTWSKTAISRMTHIDSALRESLRMNGFIERGIMKKVVAPETVHMFCVARRSGYLGTASTTTKPTIPTRTGTTHSALRAVRKSTVRRDL